MLREAAWKHERRGRLPAKIIALLTMIEDRRCKLLGLDATDKFDPTAPPPMPPDREAAVKLPQQNLSPEELRMLIGLMRKARGDQPAIETTSRPAATPTPAPAASPDVTQTAREMVAPPSRSEPAAPGFVRQADPEPEPSRSFRDIDELPRAWSPSRRPGVARIHDRRRDAMAELASTKLW